MQPGGSSRDFESIVACNEAVPKVAMVYTGQRRSGISRNRPRRQRRTLYDYAAGLHGRVNPAVR